MKCQLLHHFHRFLQVYSVTLGIVFALVAGGAGSVAGQVSSTQNKYDMTLQPISAVALKQVLQNYSDDSTMIYQLVLRAEKQKEADIAYDTLKTLRHYQPNNAIVLAGYCLAFDVYEGKYSGPDAIVHSFSGAEQEDYDQTLVRAQQLNPRLWMIYAVAGHNAGLISTQDIQSLKLYEKAENLAPYVSYTHILLGNAYATYNTPYNSFQKAAIEYNKALSLQPASAEAAYKLFDIYDVRIPNPSKAKQAKKILQSLLPPGFRLKKQASERLARY